MKAQSLALLSCLLLASLALLVEGKKEQDKKKGHSPGHRSQPRMRKPRGHFRTPDQKECRWAVVEEGDNAMLKVECSGKDNQFSCFFAGKPHSCPEFTNKKRVYWRQIGRSLVRQTNICKDSQTILKTKLCRKKFPEAHLKMVNSTLIKKKDTEAKGMTTTTRTLASGSRETIPAEGQQPSLGISGPECEQDPDIQYQRTLIQEYCGDSWASFCQFFLAIVQDKPCY
ncbi:PREDICTED: fibroblast growth factor-binding protein 1 [Chrysochloris asiatica]|uniref:Fibroblast growth factor-binding protein 1 n=1 Tax=Chrysochloris asiatica TaxID=185453 RepID=A0A9B0WZ34_CHRAS|nr:PREDICTED: fibroblast growth factor-binding protein 1 [Chrysochloris asiatica]